MKNSTIKTEQHSLTVNQATAITLSVAALGVVLQIVAGHPYPPVPPVFFILLLPAIAIGFGRGSWAGWLCLFASAFLVFGLFTSGSYHRLYHAPNAIDSIGLWIQLIAMLLTIALSITAILKRPKHPHAK